MNSVAAFAGQVRFPNSLSAFTANSAWFLGVRETGPTSVLKQTVQNHAIAMIVLVYNNIVFPVMRGTSAARWMLLSEDVLERSDGGKQSLGELAAERAAEPIVIAKRDGL